MQAPFWTQGLNRYSYAFNDPVNNTDPSGFSTDAVSGLVIFGDDHLYDFKPVSFGNGGATTGATTASEGTSAGSAGLSSATVGVGLSVLGNVLDTVLTGGPLDGSRAGGPALSVATPSAHPQGTVAGRGSAQAKNQNSGQPGPRSKLAVGGFPDPFQECDPETGACHYHIYVDIPWGDAERAGAGVVNAANALWNRLMPASRIARRLLSQSGGSVSKALAELNRLGAGQDKVIRILKEMYSVTGRGTGGVQELADGAKALLSRRVGPSQSILVVAGNGIVRGAQATIEVTGNLAAPLRAVDIVME